MEATIQIKIKLDKGKELLLSQEDAKKLYDKLHELFGEKERVAYVPYVPYTPPIITRPYTPWYTNGTTITCSDSSVSR
jgi:hypothetical protein